MVGSHERVGDAEKPGIRGPCGLRKDSYRRARPRPQRGGFATPRRGYSIYDVPAEEQTSILVPAIVSDELFQAVAEQLSANRRLGRERKRGARYLLQGLLECSCCGYAYYGRKVSRSSANGKTPYATIAAWGPMPIASVVELWRLKPGGGRP
jgi:site-specific DNA recombinase